MRAACSRRGRSRTCGRMARGLRNATNARSSAKDECSEQRTKPHSNQRAAASGVSAWPWRASSPSRERPAGGLERHNRVVPVPVVPRDGLHALERAGCPCGHDMCSAGRAGRLSSPVTRVTHVLRGHRWPPSASSSPQPSASRRRSCPSGLQRLSRPEEHALLAHGGLSRRGTACAQPLRASARTASRTGPRAPSAIAVNVCSGSQVGGVQHHSPPPPRRPAESGTMRPARVEPEIARRQDGVGPFGFFSSV